MSGGAKGSSEYELSRVPLAARLSLIAVIMVWAGLTLDPSAPYLASWWSQLFNFKTLIVGTLLANTVLSVFSSLSGALASREGLTYALATERVYGHRGAAIPSLWAGIVSLGWLAFSTGITAEALVYMFNAPREWYYPVAAALIVLFAITAYLGIKYIAWLAYVGVPALVVLIVLATFLAVSRGGFPDTGGVSLSGLPLAFGLVLGTFVNGSIVLSFDYQRFCRRPSDAIITGFVNFLGFWSFIIILSAIPAAIVGKDLYGTYMELGLMPLAAITLLLLAWTSVDAQFYSASLSWTLASKAIGRVVERRRLVMLGLLLALVLVLIKLHTFALQWLSLLTTISLPAGTTLWTDYYIVSRGRWAEEVRRVWNPKAFASWALGSVTIYATYVRTWYWYGLLLGLAVTILTYAILALVFKEPT